MLIDVIDEHELINLGIKIGSKTPREFILLKWKEIPNENVIAFIKMFSTHCFNGEYDYTTTIYNKLVIIWKDNTGIKGSIFLKYYFKSVIQETLQQEPNIETTDNSIIIKLLT